MSFNPRVSDSKFHEQDLQRDRRPNSTTQGMSSGNTSLSPSNITPFYSAAASPGEELMSPTIGRSNPNSAMMTNAELEEAMASLTLRFGDSNLNGNMDTGELLADIGLEFLLSDPALRSDDQLKSPPPFTPHRVPNSTPYLDEKPSKGLTSNTDDDLVDFYKAFKRLRIQSPSLETTRNSPTLIILSPLSYDHVFSRSWATKTHKASIVERPQRLMACSIGIGAALAHAPEKFELRASHRRPDLRNSLHVSKVHGKNWASRLYDLCGESKEKLARKEVEVPSDWHSGDLYLTPGTISALEGVVGAVEEGIDALFSETSTSRYDHAFVSVRPPGHHSHACAPSGFCLINNVHIAIQYAAKQYGVTHAVILDFDLHHGDGSQDICWDLAGFEESKKPEEKVLSKIGYFSLHDINSFPTETGYATAENIKNASVCLMAHEMCVWNIHLEKYTTEEDFMKLYDSKYSVLFKKAQEYLLQCQNEHYAQQLAATSPPSRGRGRSKSGQQPKPAEVIPFKPLILISAGFDASENENINMRRHGVHVPTSFYNRFTKDAVKLAKDFSNNKLISLLEGGYSDGALSTGIFSHLMGFSGSEVLPTRCNSEVTKKFEQGCKLKWDQSAVFRRSKSSNGDKVKLGDHDFAWLANGISLGRLLWPLEIQQATLVPTTPQTSSPPTSARILRNRVHHTDGGGR